MIRSLASDFHGTLYSDKNEGKIWEHVGKAAWKDAALSGHIFRAIGLTENMLVLKSLVSAYKKGEIGYDKIYDYFNDHVLNRVSTHDVRRYARDYAGRKDTQAKLDTRMLRPIQQANAEGTRTAILSTGYNFGIREILEKFAFDQDCQMPFDTIIANRLGQIGDGSKFNLAIYTPEDRIRELQWHMDASTVSPCETLFIADNTEYLPCMEVVHGMGGQVAAPFMATDNFKQHVAKEYDAFVPESEQDFANFLRKA